MKKSTSMVEMDLSSKLCIVHLHQCIIWASIHIFELLFSNKVKSCVSSLTHFSQADMLLEHNGFEDTANV